MENFPGSLGNGTKKSGIGCSEVAQNSRGSKTREIEVSPSHQKEVVQLGNELRNGVSLRLGGGV